VKNRFDELTRALAARESEEPVGVSRREALVRASVGMAGAVLAAFGMEPAWAARGGNPGGPGGGGGGANPCKTYCQRFSNRSERDRCLEVCRSCANTSLLCGTSGYDLTCCTGNCCSGVCTSVASDPANCGACGAGCASYPQVHSVCDAGRCGYTCYEGWANCDGVEATGCEAYLPGDPNHCGACDNVCPSNAPYCVGGACVPCPYSGLERCGDACVDINSDSANCGACGNPCGGNTPYCANGECVPCSALGLTQCGGACVDTSWDLNGTNCGGCGAEFDCPSGQVCCGEAGCMDYCACWGCGGGGGGYGY
jgi:hypothetical protein